MSEELAAAPADESIVAPVEAPAVEQAAEVEDGADETEGLDDLLQQATGAEQATPELSEVEYEGKKYTIPPELKDALLRQSDYTKKTMDLSEQRKSVEAMKADVEQLSTASQEQLQAVFATQSAQAKVDALLATPIDGLNQDQINALRLDLADAERAVEAHSARAQDATRKSQESRSQQFAKAVETARTEAAKHIPNFNDQRLTELGSLVSSLGGNPDAVKQLADPAAYRILHLADIGQKFIERQRQAGKARAAQDVQPATEVGGQRAAAARKDLVKDAASMTTEDWLKQRNAEIAKRK